jgi:histone deacetylase complex regulatory component SIN3
MYLFYFIYIQMQTLVSDSKSTALISLFESNKQQQEQSNDRSHIMYQLHANNTIGYDEHTYRIDYVCCLLFSLR